MRNFITITVSFFACIVFSQNITMQNGTFTQCSGVFTDSGGAGGSYGLNEEFTLIICPDIPGEKVIVEFTSFELIGISDFIEIFNGNTVTAQSFGLYNGIVEPPGYIIATDSNPSGCITFIFKSNDTQVSSGWEANIYCGEPCQTITSQLDSAIPAPNADGYIWVCPNENVTLDGSGVFSNDGTGATYEWDLGDGNTIVGQRAVFSYPDPGIYIVNLNIRDANTDFDPLGCKNYDLISQVIQVGTAPDFTGTLTEDSLICLGESATIKGVVNSVLFAADCTPPVGVLTALPDGTGDTYETSVPVGCYNADLKLTDTNQIIKVCINIEHSYVGDLDIFLVSPNGQEVILLSNKGDNGIYLGVPNEEDNGVPGVGAEYCFSMSATTMLVNAPTVLVGTSAENSYSPGTYLPEGDFSTLLNSPLNGNWTIRIIDNLQYDDGTIFSWNIEFDSSLLPAELSFEPIIVSETWDGDPTITNTTGSTITVTPTVAGNYCYTYRVADDFGCEYTEQVCIDVAEEVRVINTQDLVVCSAGSEEAIFDLTVNNNEVIGGQDASQFTISYYETEADANNGENEISDPSNYLSGTRVLYVRLESLYSGCFDVKNFNIEVFTIDFNLIDSYVLCVDTDGTQVVDPPVIETGLNGVNYTFNWYLNGIVIPGAVNNTYVPTQGGTYSVSVTDSVTGCITAIDDPNAVTEVYESSRPLLTAKQASLAFVESNKIIVEANSSVALVNGNTAYEFSLDGGEWKHNIPNNGTYVFENVGYGFHTVYSREINGCGTASVTLTVLDYPLYFTPNGDGYHDTWNIVGIDDQPDTKIFIFDRYGKLVKQMSSLGEGWDGTYNNKLLPSDDYWFKLEYIEPNTGKKNEFMAHFSLKR